MITGLATCRALVVEESARPFWSLTGRRRYECPTTLSAAEDAPREFRASPQRRRKVGGDT
jgi:hypothetical protein